MNKDKEVMRYFPSTLDEQQTLEMVERISFHFEEKGFGLYAVENKLSGEFMGYTGFKIPTFNSFFTPSVEIGWRYHKNFWGHGFATEAATGCLQYGFNSLHFEKINSFTAEVNIPSEKVMKRIGMNYAGSFDHPNIAPGHFLRRHVLYEIEALNAEW
jgi:ribosomal-protein-alanine N-acetyltransferase